MTKIVIPDDLTIMHSEAKRLREERDKAIQERDEALRRRDEWKKRAENHVEIVDALKAKTKEGDSRTLSRALVMALNRELEAEIAKVREVNAEQANQITYWRDRAHHAEDQLRRAQQDRMARSGE